MALFGSRGPSEAERQRESYIRRKLTEALASSLRHLEHKYAESAGEVEIYSEDSANSVCNVIEAIFMHGLKSPTSMTSKMSNLLIGPEVGKIPQPSFWEVLKKITHRDVISQLNHFGQITTEIGMCRAWVRIALNDGLLESYLDALYQDKASLRRHYKQTGYLRDEEQRDIMKTFTQGLQAFVFKLSYNSSVLNIWTTTPLVLAGIIEPMVSTRTTTAVINKPSTASVAASPASESTGVSNARTRRPTREPSRIEVTHNRSTKSRPSRVVSSIGYVSDVPGGAGMPATPPNTPYDSGMLTQNDIDVMRKMSRKVHQAGSASTPTSQISAPDPARRDEEPNIPFVLPKDIKEESMTDVTVSESNEDEFLDAQQSFGESERSSEKEEFCDVNEEVTDKMEEIEQKMEEFQTKKVLEPLEGFEGKTEVFKRIKEELEENEEISKKTEGLEGKMEESSGIEESRETIEHSNKGKEEITQTEGLKDPPEGSQEKMEESEEQSAELVGKEEITEKSDGKTSEKEEMEERKEELEETGVEGEVFRIMKVPLAEEKSGASQYDRNETPSGSPGSSKDANLARRQSPAFLHIRRKSQPLEPEEVKITAENPSVDEVGQAASPSNQDQARLIFEPSIYDKIRMPNPQSNSLGTGQMRGWSSEFEDGDDEVTPIATASMATTTSIATAPMTTNIATRPHAANFEEELLRDIMNEDFDSKLTNSEEDVFTKPIEINFGKSPEDSRRLRNSQSEPVNLAAKMTKRQISESRQSYDDLLNSYGPAVQTVGTLTMHDVLEALGSSCESGMSRSPPEEPVESTEYPGDYEILAVGPSCTEDMHRQQLGSIIGQITNEQGLDSQNFQCRSCSRPIGIIYGNPRLCTYDACYYCFECHENEDYFIPSRIVYNWDFNRFRVCSSSLEFLKEVEELPMLNVQQLNPRLYEHVREMKEALDVRTQLRYLKAYLFTCRQSVADELRKQVWPKEYLYEDVHLYSLQDLLQIQAGYFCGGIRKLIKFASRHVYDCRLCSQKGFICEICQNPKVIYPFEMETTSRCDICQSVYHKNCLSVKPPCPKCERLRRRSLPPNPEAMDYACLPDSDS